MHLLYQIFIDPFVQMGTAPDLLAQTLWDGLVAGVLYALIALGFVLIFKASGVFNFAQGIMVVFAALTLVGLHEHGVPAFLALGAHRRRHVCAGGRRRAPDAAAAGQPVRRHLVHGHLRPDLHSDRFRPARVRRQSQGDDHERALPAERGNRIQGSWRFRFVSENRHRRGDHCFDHGRGAGGILSAHPHRPGVARGRRQSSGGAVGRHFARADLGDRVVRCRRRRADHRHHVGRALGGLVSRCRSSRSRLCRS